MTSGNSEHPLIQRWSHGGPKRILSIDGGGVRGIVALAFLEHIEAAARKQYGVTCLAEHFDLIAGTSTGSIIATLLALGKSVEEIRSLYLTFCKKAFSPNLLGRWTAGMIASKFQFRPLERLAHEVFGNIKLGDAALLTGVLIMLHRADSNSPWPVHNHPAGKFYGHLENAEHLANKDLPIANLVLASCAAPSFFRPQQIEIGRLTNGEILHGLFVDGSLSPHKNPALQALRVATIPGYGFNWPVGEDQLSIVSVGTGMRGRRVTHQRFLPSGLLAIQTLFALLDTCNDEIELMLQWMSSSPTARAIDSEIGTLSGCCITGQPAFRYWRFNLPLNRQWLAQHLDYQVTDATLDRLYRMDGVQNIAELEAMAKERTERCVTAEFDSATT
jgi:uncharacterized protein